MRIGESRELMRLLMKFDPMAAKLNRSVLLLSLASLAGCSSTANSPRYATYSSYGSAIDSKYGVRASPRVVADGEEVPKGGGNYMVGKPYKIAGQTYYPNEKPFSATGTASWYGSDFHGRRTANGEIFDRESISAAHPTMPLPSYARVTNLKNLRSIVVRVNDRGPYHGGRVMDVSQRVAEALDFRSAGTAKVKVEWVGKADMAGDDDAKLLATLRDDGQPAAIEGGATTMVASRQEPVRTAALVDQTLESMARPAAAETNEMMAYAPPENTRPEPMPETATASRDEAAADPESAAGTRGARSAAPADEKMKSFQAAPLPPVRPASLGGHNEASVPTPPLRQALN
jgi:rare lipoprotein A